MLSRFGFHTNHFGISEEELEYDENDPSWLITSPGANVLHGSYESAKPFVEKMQRQQRAFLEEKLEERRELRQAIRERVSRDFDKKLKQHMAKFQPKPQERLVLELFLSQQKKELEESFRQRLGKSHVSKSEGVLGSLTNISGSVSHHSTSKPVLLKESTSTASKSQSRTETSTSVSYLSSSAISDKTLPNTLVTAVSVTPTISAVPSIVDRITPKNIPSFHMSTASISSLQSYSTPRIHQKSDISSSLAFFPQKTSVPPSVSSSETLKGGHATLTRTDSVSSCKSSVSRSTSWSLQQIVEEEQSLSNKASFTAAAKGNDSIVQFLSKLESLTVNSGMSDDANIKSSNQYHQIFGHEIAFARTFMANAATASDSMRNGLKCTIKEKISVSTKKFAKQSDVAQIVRFFSNLLNGLTIYGFNDKMVNLKNDELARDWAMVHIIDTYLDLVPQDMSLLKVVAAVLSSLASSSIIFSKLLYGKLFVSSPLLAVNHNECLKCISDLRKRSERFAETVVAWHSRQIAIINLFIALKMSNVSTGSQITPENYGLGLMWKIVAVTAAENSAFGATLITEILKQHWTAMHQVYGRQMEKLVMLIDGSVLPQWRASLKKIALDDLEMNETIRSVAENYLTSLRFTVDNCLLSFRS
uniref:GLE1 RNA export mediator n=1 Tax=Elaeophora elaphi TaxID=1147741 RepID=A0A0R3RIE0_9BILA